MGGGLIDNRIILFFFPGGTLLGIKPRMSGSTVHPKPPNTRLHLDRLDKGIILQRERDKTQAYMNNKH